ncbi:MAG TPA: LysR substrate-binding domain-containing protein [Phenylobacterium sp.]|nr:LysR substrate-binding domain-containing protein [Phenylobacterium sp.]
MSFDAAQSEYDSADLPRRHTTSKSDDAAPVRAPGRPSPIPLRTLPSLSALQAFQRSGIQLSFRRAARDLALSPSAISHQIRNLEEHFGVRLFARDGRVVRLTAEGERYLEAVTRSLSMLEEASRGLMHQGRGGRRELRVSGLPFFVSTVLIPSLSEFEKRWPDLTLRIESTHEYADFNRADVDVAIRLGRERTAGLRLEPLIEVRGMPVCSPEVAARGISEPEDLARHVLIHVSSQPRAWTAWLKGVGCADLEPRGHLWFDSLPAALDAAEHGLGVALAPHPLINGRKGFGETLVPVGPPCNRSQTYNLVCRPEQYDARWITAFRNWLTQALGRSADPRIN